MALEEGQTSGVTVPNVRCQPITQRWTWSYKSTVMALTPAPPLRQLLFPSGTSPTELWPRVPPNHLRPAGRTVEPCHESYAVRRCLGPGSVLVLQAGRHHDQHLLRRGRSTSQSKWPTTPSNLQGPSRGCLATVTLATRCLLLATNLRGGLRALASADFATTCLRRRSSRHATSRINSTPATHISLRVLRARTGDDAFSNPRCRATRVRSAPRAPARCAWRRRPPAPSESR